MKEEIRRKIQSCIAEYCEARELKRLWEEPILKAADARNPLFGKLREIVEEGHHLPTDYLPEAATALSYFLPFRPGVAESNVGDGACSAVWARAYLVTNAMAAWINEELARFLRDRGWAAAVPTDAGMIGQENPRSRWSQRHVAYIAGHGTFGLNNMLISDAGCTGRYFSLVTALPIEPDEIVKAERCLYKKDGGCGVCVQKCFPGALTFSGFDRFRCLEQCLKNEALYEGASVCGKCVVGVPCSFMKSSQGI